MPLPLTLAQGGCCDPLQGGGLYPEPLLLLLLLLVVVVVVRMLQGCCRHMPQGGRPTPGGPARWRGSCGAAAPPAAATSAAVPNDENNPVGGTGISTRHCVTRCSSGRSHLQLQRFHDAIAASCHHERFGVIAGGTHVCCSPHEFQDSKCAIRAPLTCSCSSFTVPSEPAVATKAVASSPEVDAPAATPKTLTASVRWSLPTAFTPCSHHLEI